MRTHANAADSLTHSPVKVLEELHRHHELVGEEELRVPPELLAEHLGGNIHK